MDHRLKPSELDKAYVAGLFDGEGTLSVSRQGGYKGTRYAHLKCAIYNTNKDVLEWVNLRWPGTVKYRQGWETINSKIVYAYVPFVTSLEVFLLDVQPYVKIKQFQVSLAIEFRELVRKTSEQMVPGKGRADVYAYNLPRRNEIASLMSLANRRGMHIDGR